MGTAPGTQSPAVEPELFQAVVLAIVQGVTEFLPISSSGHLILVPWLLGWPDHGLTFDVALHLGTALALLGYFWREWLALARAVVGGFARAEARKGPHWRLAWLLLLGGVPAGVIGVLFEDIIERNLRQPILIATLLIVFGLALFVADRLSRRQRGLEEVTFPDALMVGCAQALALLPGVSRSGVTITAGLLLGFDRAAAARFSFLLSAPIVVAAGVYRLRLLLQSPPSGSEALVFLAGIAVAAIVGALTIGFLLRYLQRQSTVVFVWYRLLVGFGVLALALTGR